MRPIWYAVIVVLLASFAFATSGRITGTLIDEYGAPVPHMSVEACPADIGFSGILPSAVTDQQGKFIIRIRTLHEPERWKVYAYNEDTGYYPRPQYAFYGENGAYAQTVELSPDSPEASVELTLGPKAGALIAQVVDAATGHRVLAELSFDWVSDSANERIVSFSYYGTKEFRILLPANTDLTLTVTAQGYRVWSYPGVMNVGPGQDLPLDIVLEAEASSTQNSP